MKLKLNKKQLKNLSNDRNAVPAAMTPQIAGGDSVVGNTANNGVGGVGGGWGNGSVSIVGGGSLGCNWDVPHTGSMKCPE